MTALARVRRPGRGGVLYAVLGTAVLVTMPGCTASSASTAGAPSSLPSAGSYPVATVPPQAQATPTVSAGHYQVVAAGVPVRAFLSGARVLITALGPELGPVATMAAVTARATGVLTVRVASEQGRLALPAGTFVVRDEQQRPVAVRASPVRVTAAPRQPALMRLRAVFQGGHTTLTWQPLGRPMVTWDFVVELD